MKIILPQIDENALGGGWSFCRNFRKAMGGNIVTDYDQADVGIQKCNIGKDKAVRFVHRQTYWNPLLAGSE